MRWILSRVCYTDKRSLELLDDCAAMCPRPRPISLSSSCISYIPSAGAAPAAGRPTKAGGRRNRKGGAGSPGRGSPRRGDSYPGGAALGSDQQRSSEAKRRERKEQLKGLLRQLLGVGSATGATAATATTAWQGRAASDGRVGVTQLMQAFHALATGGASVGNSGQGREEEAGAAGAMQRQRSGASGRLSRQRSGELLLAVLRWLIPAWCCAGVTHPAMRCCR